MCISAFDNSSISETSLRLLSIICSLVQVIISFFVQVLPGFTLAFLQCCLLCQFMYSKIQISFVICHSVDSVLHQIDLPFLLIVFIAVLL